MIDTDKYEERIKSIPIRKLKVGCTLLEDSAFLRDAGLELLAEVKRLRNIINKAMQQHGVLEMRGCLFESGCVDAEGQYESGHWEREGEEK